MSILPTAPQKLVGNWREGFALDLHTVSSSFAGYDEFGHETWDTVRTKVGESLYQLKYSQDAQKVAELAETAAAFVKNWGCGVDVVVPVPPSKARAVPPVMLVGKALAESLGIAFEPNAVARTKQLPELKNVGDFGERQKLLLDAHTVDVTKVKGRKVLLFDDLFRSGATMNAVVDALMKGGASSVFALALTRTRSSR